MHNFAFDNEYRKQGFVYIVGIDEAGRGPLAGPVVAAAVILPPAFYDERITDSKKISKETLTELALLIKENALSYALGFVDAPMIDEINILNATKLAMLNALESLTHEYDIVLLDAVKLSGLKKKSEAIVKGDEKSFSIAASSILAKVARDEYMDELHLKYPHYAFNEHKGYPTKKHLQLLEIYGPLDEIHRFSYKPVKNAKYRQIKLF
ncbi:MAG TPA: ribonuclease HII [Bacilli bacterium]|nr:ribonuclease HII [Bacilli bacterium]